MKKAYTILTLILTMTWSLSQAQQSDPYEVRFLEKGYGSIDPTFQKNLRNSPAWKAYDETHPGWMVQFDEDNQLPLRAFGQGVQVNGQDPVERSWNFMEEHIDQFIGDGVSLEYSTTTDNGKHQQVFFKQMHNGLEVLLSKAMVKSTYDGKVVSWATVIHSNINVATTATLSPSQAASAAMENVNGAQFPVLNDDLKILPIPVNREYVEHLVYEVTFEAEWDNGMPARYSPW